LLNSFQIAFLWGGDECARGKEVPISGAISYALSDSVKLYVRGKEEEAKYPAELFHEDEEI